VAVVLAAVGLYLLGILPLRWSSLSLPRYHGLWAAFLLGLVFGIGVGPCTFAYMAPVLGLVFNVAAERPVFAIMLVLAYAAGHCVLIVLAGVCTGAVQRVIDWNDESRAAKWIKRVCGVMILVGSGWMIYMA
jgi:cytochrome c-type biogenesis protein